MQFGNNINKFFFIKDEANRRKRRRKDASSEEDMQDMQNLTSIEGMKSQDILDTALSLKGHLMDRSDLEVQDCRWRFACVIKMSEAPGASDDDKWNGQIAAYELAVLLCQLGQSEQADKYLSALGFRYKLSEFIFAPSFTGHKKCKKTNTSTLARAIDGAIPASLLETLRVCFGSDSSFWVDHNYPTPAFFSYNELRGSGSVIDSLVSQHILPIVSQAFPEKKLNSNVHSYEWWSHCRNDAKSGGAHQLHFDLDETRLAKSGKAHSPLVSVVIYLTNGSSNLAPTLVTDQVLHPDSVASHAVLCTPKQGRILMFDGQLLHGVVPYIPTEEDFIAAEIEAEKANLGNQESCRITLMIGLWGKGVTTSKTPKKISHSTPLTSNMRPAYDFGSAGHYKDSDTLSYKNNTNKVEFTPIEEISPVWTQVEGIYTNPDPTTPLEINDMKEKTVNIRKSSIGEARSSEIETMSVTEILAQQAKQQQNSNQDSIDEEKDEDEDEEHPVQSVDFFGRWFLRDLGDIYREVLPYGGK